MLMLMTMIQLDKKHDHDSLIKKSCYDKPVLKVAFQSLENCRVTATVVVRVKCSNTHLRMCVLSKKVKYE